MLKYTCVAIGYFSESCFSVKIPTTVRLAAYTHAQPWDRYCTWPSNLQVQFADKVTTHILVANLHKVTTPS